MSETIDEQLKRQNVREAVSQRVIDKSVSGEVAAKTLSARKTKCRDYLSCRKFKELPKGGICDVAKCGRKKNFI
ncbi:hypothetical protein ACM9XA_12855 [Xanthomonas sacchari]|uniref:hypothetical protein n=1 Tax=Xanthomonas sacchari TaxID=56458 RepID=UPI00224DCBB0|nr:hypothetical protein [Xanthomonas sacchari]